jgi:hypothetical protein
MGADFSSHQLFAGSQDALRVRAGLIDLLHSHCRAQGLIAVADEAEADRGFVVGPAERWVFIGDTAGSADLSDQAAFSAASRAVSRIGPVVDIEMSDHAAVRFLLYRDGELIDCFGNLAFPFFAFRSEDEARAFAGDPEQWRDLLCDPGRIADLRGAWTQGVETDAGGILDATAELFGWNPLLAWIGYTYDNEGIPAKYSAWFDPGEIDLTAFDEFYFRNPSTPGRPECKGAPWRENV